MQAKWRFSRHHALVCSADSLSGLAKLLESRKDKLSWTAQCADHTERSGTGIQGLLDFDNVASRQIEALNIVANNYSRHQDEHFKVAISIRSSYDVPGPVALTADVDGPADFVDRTRPELEHWLRGLRAWYWPAAKVTAFTALLTPLVVIVAFAAVIDTAQFFELIGGNTTEPANTTDTPPPIGLFVAVASYLHNIRMGSAQASKLELPQC